MPPSPTSPSSRKHHIIPGFRPPPRPKQTPIAEMTVRELQDRYNLNAKILTAPDVSTSTYVQRVSTEQAAVQSRLLDLTGVEAINHGLRNTRLTGENEMNVDPPYEPPVSRTLEAKRKALARFGPQSGPSSSGALSMQEAMDLERQAHLQDMERQQRLMEKRRRQGMPINGEILTRQEREARIWNYMNHKPSESDMEDDDEDEDEDDDPATWFDDDQDDGRKGQDIIEPDFEDYSNVIRVDDSRMPQSYYTSRDDRDGD